MEDMLSFPPFYTLQPVKETRDKQLQQWLDLVVSHCRSSAEWEIDNSFSLFENAAINRRLSDSGREEVISYLVQKGACERVGDGTKRVHVLWKSIAEWEACLLDWAHTTGRRDDVMTVDELCTSDEFHNEDFHGMPASLMEKILRRLEKAKKVTLFQGSDQDDQGVKFL